MDLKLNLIVAATAINMGIGFKGTIPWRLKKDLAMFANLTKATNLPSKKNAVIMGRRTWESIPDKFCPLPGRVNVVLTRSQFLAPTDGLFCSSSLADALLKLKSAPFDKLIETVWIIGGSSVYKEALDHPSCHRIYLTVVHNEFECDVFMPQIDKEKFSLVSDPVSSGFQEEDGLEFSVEVYEKKNQI